MRHRVNIIQENIEINEVSGSDDGSEGDQLARMLRKKLEKDNTYAGRRPKRIVGGLGSDDDLDRGDGANGSGSEEDDWNNNKTGGVIQLENQDGTVA